ncbi:MAG: ExeM/NucH family extracellular endonuclease [Anaerolineales bacterium]
MFKRSGTAARSFRAVMLSTILVLLPALALQAQSAGTAIFINEIHYDNVSTDADEAVEIAGPAGTDLAGWSLVFYNGNGGAQYADLDLSGLILDEGDGYGALAFAQSGIQNGSPDGIALVDPGGAVIQFLSYEGSFTAVGGPADGLTSTDIGVSEPNDTPLGESLQLTGVGTIYEDFVWNAPAASSFGAINVGQSFGGTPPTPTPEPPPEVAISEIRIDQPGTDTDEYFELAGAPGTSLDGLTYLVIGDSTAGASGVIENVTDLSGAVIPASGYFVAAEDTFSLGTADLVTSLNFENDDNVTHLLVQGFTGSNGEDLDTNDDGILDVTPWTAQVDLIALIKEDNPPTDTEYHYGPPTVGPDGSYVPGLAFVCPSGWTIGAFDPLDGEDTPGAANHCVVPPPDVLISEIRIDQDGTDTDEFFELVGPPGASLDGLTYLVIGDSTSGGSGVIENVTDLNGSTIPASGYFVAAESTFTLGTADLVASLNFENSDNVTHLLVQGFTGSNGEDLDTNDDGVLDFTPWSAIVDLIALIEEENPPTGTEYSYGPPTVGPDGSYVPGYVFRCEDGFRIGPFTVGGETPGAANNCFFGFCGDDATPIHAIQGTGDTSPLVGQVVVAEGVVVGDFQGYDGLGGFFLQEETADEDADPATSEGIFVYDGSFGVDVAYGDVVRLQAGVSEYYGLTELSGVNNLIICSTGYEPQPTAFNLPAANMDDFERREGMLVTFPQTLTVTGNYTQGRYGEVDLSADGRLYTPTNVTLPGEAADALQQQNNLRLIQLDDGSSVENPLPLPPYLIDGTTLRAGDTVSGLTGALGYAYSRYEIQPVQPVELAVGNARPLTAPDTGGRLIVASFNVLNYFTTIDEGNPICGPEENQDCRGADSVEEFVRQRDKIVSAIAAMDADVVGLIELENNASASLADLVAGLNDVVGTGTYAYVDTGTIGSDAIKVGFLYQPASVTPVGDFALLDTSVDPGFNDEYNRPALAQTFAENISGEAFTVVVNHLKSKGSACDDIGDPDTGDGQGNCNLTRTSAAIALANWLASDPTGSGDPDFIIMGDLNSYAMEDPIAALQSAGYTDMVNLFEGSLAYSYVFDGQAGYLDHALANGNLAPQVTDVAIWHINADEPAALDYNDYNQPDLYAPDPFRASDHDPVMVGLNLIPQCGGENATIYVDFNGMIVGGPQDGQAYHFLIRGTSGDDVIVGTDGDDLILGGAGNDIVCGLGGNDLLLGQKGDDQLFGGAGYDLLVGGLGDDLIDAGADRDLLNGGHGYDVCLGGSGRDRAVLCEEKQDIP